MRAIGKHWDMHDTTSSSENEEESEPPSPKDETPKKPLVRRRRNRTEIIMDLKDMVVRKRMASLNASAILAASYSIEKKGLKKNEDSESETSEESFAAKLSEAEKNNYESDVKEDDRNVIEVRAKPNKKVSVIVNQDTDVTITGVYVNSTTRSTHHEEYCSIAGMQYRISATSHTQTAATAVATETILQSSGNHDTPENVSYLH